jgi:hypothetical protein
LLGSGKSPGSTASEVGRLSIKGATRKWHQIAPPTGSAAVKGERLLLLASVVKTVKAKGLDDRMRDSGGEIRKKRSDTLVKTLREEYGANFAEGYRPNTKLGAVLKKEGVQTLDQLLRKTRARTR